MLPTLIDFILAKVINFFFFFFFFLWHEKLKEVIFQYEAETITKYSFWCNETLETMVCRNEITLEAKINGTQPQ